MELLNELIEKMKASDAIGLSELFCDDARFDDFCLSGMFSHETHLIGKEAIDIHFFNRLIFQTYIVTGGEVKDDENAVMNVMIVGNPVKVNVHLDTVVDGKIDRVTLTPVA